MNKLYTTLLIACLAAGFTACNDDDCEDLHLGNLAHYPNVLKGTFPTESQVLELGETLEITPELLNPEGATYSWLVNGKEYSINSLKIFLFTYSILRNLCNFKDLNIKIVERKIDIILANNIPLTPNLKIAINSTFKITFKLPLIQLPAAYNILFPNPLGICKTIAFIDKPKTYIISWKVYL